MTGIVLVPGLWNSGPEHWQSHWERERTNCRWVLQREWETPRCSDWVAALDVAVARSSLPVVLAAHAWAARRALGAERPFQLGGILDEGPLLGKGSLEHVDGTGGRRHPCPTGAEPRCRQ